MLTFFVVIALVCLVAVPIAFIWHEVYNDGVFGRAGLGMIALFAFIRLCRMIDGTAPDAPLELDFLVIGMAVFIVWHLFRFHYRVLKAKRDPAVTFHQGEPS